MIFKQIPNCPGYFATDTGKIYSTKKNKFKKIRHYVNKGGYAMVCIVDSGKPKTRRVHRLVALAFYGPPPDGTECSHIDGNSLNNNISNLEWSNHSSNNQLKIVHGTMARGDKIWSTKLKYDDVINIKSQIKDGKGFAEIALNYNVNPQTISDIYHERSWVYVQ